MAIFYAGLPYNVLTFGWTNSPWSGRGHDYMNFLNLGK